LMTAGKAEGGRKAESTFADRGKKGGVADFVTVSEIKKNTKAARKKKKTIKNV